MTSALLGASIQEAPGDESINPGISEAGASALAEPAHLFPLFLDSGSQAGEGACGRVLRSQSTKGLPPWWPMGTEGKLTAARGKAGVWRLGCG